LGRVKQIDATRLDALLIREDVDTLGDMIASTGRTLITISSRTGTVTTFSEAIVSSRDFQASSARTFDWAACNYMQDW